MPNTLTFFTPRSGSSYINDLLSLQHDNVNLDEFLHSRVRGSYFDRLPKDVKSIITQLQQHTLLDYTNKKQIVEAINQFNKRVAAVNFITTARGVSLKCTPNHSMLPTYSLIQSCIENDYNVYFIYRDLEQQLYSVLCSRVRAQIATQNGLNIESAFVNFKNSTGGFKFQPVVFPIDQALTEISNLHRYMQVWICHYAMFKSSVKTFSYQQFIQDPSIANVSKQTIDVYNSRNDVIQSSDIQPIGSLILNWDQIVEYIEPIKQLYQAIEV